MQGIRVGGLCVGAKVSYSSAEPVALLQRPAATCETRKNKNKKNNICINFSDCYLPPVTCDWAVFYYL